MNPFKFLHNDKVLTVAGALVGVAIAVKALTPPYTIAAQAADFVIAAGAFLGVTSTTSRAAK